MEELSSQKTPPGPDSRSWSSRLAVALGLLLTFAVCSVHTWGIWLAIGGAQGLTNGSPLWRNDHPLYFHSALVTREFLKRSGTTAGYDPSFMAGYAKSVVFPASSTLPELAIFFFGGSRPELTYKVYVLIASAALPWLLAWAACLCKLSWPTIALATLLEILYVWCDFPINYVEFGMVPYFLGIPLSLVATIAFARYLEAGGLSWWLLVALLSSLSFMVHLTTAMIVAPAALLVYAVESRRRPGGLGRKMHIQVWAIPCVVLATNAFWWLPGLTLASTKGSSDFAFVHPEGILSRLGRLFTYEAPVESFWIGIGLVGMSTFLARSRILGTALIGYTVAGFTWGYLAAGVRGLDFLQPGRHTYAFYTGLSLAGAIGIMEGLSRLRQTGGTYHRWAILALIIIGTRLFVPVWDLGLFKKFNQTQGLLVSEPSARMTFVLDLIKLHVKKGERLLYEEGGFGPDPFQSGRFSGLIPWATNFEVEVLGGPYLHASLRSNFTQFGEGRLFGQSGWGRERFETYAKLYRPQVIVCWSAQARAFCLSNSDLITVKADDGVILVGRIHGFGGDTIMGQARVEASPGRLTVYPIKAELDGSIVLRYHSVPGLFSRSDAKWEEIRLQGDPVPFVRLKSLDGPITLEWHLAP